MMLEIMPHVQEVPSPTGRHLSLVSHGSIMDMTVSNTYPNHISKPRMPVLCFWISFRYSYGQNNKLSLTVKVGKPGIILTYLMLLKLLLDYF